jgi:hypothetical protein
MAVPAPGPVVPDVARKSSERPHMFRYTWCGAPQPVFQKRNSPPAAGDTLWQQATGARGACSRPSIGIRSRSRSPTSTRGSPEAVGTPGSIPSPSPLRPESPCRAAAPKGWRPPASSSCPSRAGSPGSPSQPPPRPG